MNAPTRVPIAFGPTIASAVTPIAVESAAYMFCLQTRVVCDVHDALEHSAPSDAVGVGSEAPRFKPIIVKYELLPMLAGAFDGITTVSTGAALGARKVAAKQSFMLHGIVAGRATFTVEGERSDQSPQL